MTPDTGGSSLLAEVLELLACPSDDHAALRLVDGSDGAELECVFCRSRYPIRDGIPVLLLDDAVPGPNGIGHDADAGVAPR